MLYYFVAEIWPFPKNHLEQFCVYMCIIFSYSENGISFEI